MLVPRECWKLPGKSFKRLPGSLFLPPQGAKIGKTREVGGGVVIRPLYKTGKQRETPCKPYGKPQKQFGVKTAFDTTERLVKNMIPKTVQRSAVFTEFSEKDRENWFTLTRAKVLPHIDNIYYNVHITGDSGENPPEGVQKMLEELRDAKREKTRAYGNEVALWNLDVYPSNFATYEFRLSDDGNFDIFVASYLPNDSTPRIEVQVRTRLLVLRGVDNALHDSFLAVEQILATFGLSCCKIGENRIDYAYHTNLIQNPLEFFGDPSLERHVKTKLKTVNKVYDYEKKLIWSYMSLGMRKSNCVFFRVYDKSREVCEKAYKGFFLDRWVQHGLISRYDFYCYMEAYRNRSYKVGLMIGRIKWYLEYGKDADRKASLQKVLDTCYIKDCNTDAIRRALKGVLPEVTVICNVEFETKRKFYLSMASWLESYEDTVKIESKLQPQFGRLIRILSFQQTIHEYLTSTVVKFVQDQTRKDGPDNPMLDWWYRIHRCKVADFPALPDFKRSYDTRPDLLRAKKSFMSSTAYLTMLLKKSTESWRTSPTFSLI